MIVIRVEVKIKPEETADFVNHMKQEMIEVKKQFGGCERFALYESVADESAYLLYEEWESQTSFDAYKNSDYFKKNGEKLFPMMAEQPDSVYYDAAVI